ncbi:MAG: GNAT family N-acetyltransferase [Armatimonadetes bacterium]|nr:GNAT family N-acetyltransferase [Armatimonadota bacterium]
MIDFRPILLTGQRARLVPMEPDHAAGLWEAGRHPDIWRYMPVARPEALADMQGLVRAALAEQARGTSLPFTIMDQETNAIVGSTRFLDIVPVHRQLEIGWTWLTPAAQRTRINTECKYLLLRHAFETLGLIRVQLKTDARNERSQRAMERIGAIREGVLRRHRILPDGFVRDSVYYSVIVEEWPQAKAHLERLLDRYASSDS